MKTKYIDIDENKWGVVLIYDFDMLDWDNMAAVMRAFGLKRNKVNYAIRVLSTYNSGLTISNPDLRMSVVFIGQPTSKSQFWNSVSHEMKHVTDAIIEYYAKPCDGESAAYLSGYLLQKVVEEFT